ANKTDIASALRIGPLMDYFKFAGLHLLFQLFKFLAFFSCDRSLSSSATHHKKDYSEYGEAFPVQRFCHCFHNAVFIVLWFSSFKLVKISAGTAWCGLIFSELVELTSENGWRQIIGLPREVRLCLFFLRPIPFLPHSLPR